MSLVSEEEGTRLLGIVFSFLWETPLSARLALFPPVAFPFFIKVLTATVSEHALLATFAEKPSRPSKSLFCCNLRRKNHDTTVKERVKGD